MKVVFFHLISIILVLGNAHDNEPKWIYNLEEAKNQARNQNKHILLVFSGSDWCRNCMLLEQEVFTTKDFQQLASTRMILLKADFPRKKKNQLPETQQSINSQLAKKFNPDGAFPKVVLMNTDEKILLTTGYQQGQKSNFLQELGKFLDE